MDQSKNHIEVNFLARLAGISVPEERLAALKMGLGGTQAVCDSLARVDYGTVSPGFRGKMPPSR